MHKQYKQQYKERKRIIQKQQQIIYKKMTKLKINIMEKAIK